MTKMSSMRTKTSKKNTSRILEYPLITQRGCVFIVQFLTKLITECSCYCCYTTYLNTSQYQGQYYANRHKLFYYCFMIVLGIEYCALHVHVYCRYCEFPQTARIVYTWMKLCLVHVYHQWDIGIVQDTLPYYAGPHGVHNRGPSSIMKTILLSLCFPAGYRYYGFIINS